MLKKNHDEQNRRVRQQADGPSCKIEASSPSSPSSAEQVPVEPFLSLALTGAYSVLRNVVRQGRRLRVRDFDAAQAAEPCRCRPANTCDQIAGSLPAIQPRPFSPPPNATTEESWSELEKNCPRSNGSPALAPVPRLGSTTAAADAIVTLRQTARAAHVFVFTLCCFNLLTSTGKARHAPRC